VKGKFLNREGARQAVAVSRNSLSQPRSYRKKRKIYVSAKEMGNLRTKGLSKRDFERARTEEWLKGWQEVY